MADENSSNSGVMDKVDDAMMKMSIALAIVDLITEVDPSCLSEKTIRYAGFHLREIMEKLEEHQRFFIDSILKKDSPKKEMDPSWREDALEKIKIEVEKNYQRRAAERESQKKIHKSRMKAIQE